MKTVNKVFAGVLLACLSSSMHAQIAKWLVQPTYDHIEMIDGGLLKVNSDGKVGLLNKNGKELLSAEFDSITSFKEDRALLFKNGAFYGIIDKQGHVTSLFEKGYELPYDANHYSSGLLLVTLNRQFFFLNKKGESVYGPYAKAYPFFDNHACVEAYVDYQKKPNETFYDCINSDGTPFRLQEYSKEDINFMSSFNNGKAVIVLKKKFYVIDAETFQLTPLSTDSTANKKSLVISDGKEIQVHKGDEGYLLLAKKRRVRF